ncbi:PREDICTED: LOW QUALITY PROTEIN: serine-rich adhesin for platelets-like, partial [Rhagoletis zephyria]|uniref:LOW QUALITY PROTEIN: serine-rich adhesin for platelets-like n=1 Tax=Rhagoletis zephyria TaxID=28612 RepID=UPI000811437E
MNPSEPYHRPNIIFSQRSDPPYYRSQWNLNRYKNGPNNRNNSRWINNSMYNNNSNNCNTNSKYEKNETGRRRDNSVPPYSNESDRKSLSSQNITNTTETAKTERRSESTPAASNRVTVTEESKIVENVGVKNSTQNTATEKDKKKSDNVIPTQIRKLNEVRTSPRKRPPKKDSKNASKVTPSSAKAKNSPKTGSEISRKNPSGSNLGKDKDKIAVAESSEVNTKTNELKSTSENVTKSRENSLTVETRTDQVSTESTENNSLKLPPVVCAKQSDKVNKKILAVKPKTAKESCQAKSRDVSKGSKDKEKKPIDVKQSTKENKTDIEKEGDVVINISAVSGSSKSLQIETNESAINTVNVRIEAEEIIAAPVPEIPCIEIDLNTSDSSENREGIDEEISNLECKVSPIKEPSDKPRISIIPLSRLIRNELIELTDDSSVAELEDAPAPVIATSTPTKRVCRPNLVKRRRQISTCSNSSGTTENLIEKVAGMDKFGIKQVINNSGTRFDEALKAQARKRLREEIRKQLKSMNLEAAKDSEDVNFVPDDIVDAICIPDIVLEEIRKAFGIEIFYKKDAQPSDNPLDESAANVVEIAVGEGGNVTAINASPPLQESLVETTSTAVQPVVESVADNAKKDAAKETTTQNEVGQTMQNEVAQTMQNEVGQTAPQPTHSCHNEQAVIEDQKDPKLTETVKAPTAAEGEKKPTEKLTKKHQSSTSRKHSRKKTLKDVILVESSSSSSSTSSSSSSSSSSSDSESETSARSVSSSVKRRRLKLRVDAQNVVESFEKLILPSISESLKARYRNKFSNSTYTRLHFISCICTSEYNTRKFTKPEIAKIQSNLKSEDRTVALEFLMREIVSVFNKQKEAAKRERGSNRTRKETESSPDKPQSSRAQAEDMSRRYDAGGDKANGISKQQAVKGSSSSSRSRSGSGSGSSNKKSANAAEKNDVGKNYVQSQRTPVPSPTKNPHQSVNSQALMNTSASDGVRRKSAGNAKTADEAAAAAGGGRRKTSADTAAETRNNLHEMSNTTNQEDSNGKSLASATTRQQLPTTTSTTITTTNAEGIATAYEQQLHNSIFESANTAAPLNESSSSIGLHSPPANRSLLDNKLSGSGASNLLTGFEHSINGLFGMPSVPSLISSTLFPNVDLEALRQRNILGEFVVNNLREYDMKLMELHKRKMFIEEMILKLQRDKMEVDMQTMQLQNEKFFLLNTAMTAAASELPKREAAAAAAAARTSSLSPPGASTAPHLDAQPSQQELPNGNARTMQSTNANQRKRKANDNIGSNAKRKRGPRKRGGAAAAKKRANKSKLPTETVQMPTPTATQKTPAVGAATRERFRVQSFQIWNRLSPMTQLHLYERWLVATGEDGRLYQFCAKTLKMEKEFAKHSENITHSYLCCEKKVLYTTSLDGYLKKTSLE